MEVRLLSSAFHHSSDGRRRERKEQTTHSRHSTLLPIPPPRVIVDLIIPAYNEAENIEALFDELDQMPAGMIRQIIITDNNSTDNTAALAKARGAIVLHESQRGYGSSCLKAIRWIEQQDNIELADVIVFLDADLSDDPQELPRLLDEFETSSASAPQSPPNELQKTSKHSPPSWTESFPVAKSKSPKVHTDAVMIIGSRVAHAEPGSLNVAQRFGNRLACFLIRLFTGRRYSDLGPFRAITWQALQQLDMQDTTWGWTVEMQMKAAILKLPFAEVDVAYRKRHAGKSKISGTLRGIFAAGSKIISTIIALWWQRNKIRNTPISYANTNRQ